MVELTGRNTCCTSSAFRTRTGPGSWVATKRSTGSGLMIFQHLGDCAVIIHLTGYFEDEESKTDDVVAYW